MYGALVHRAWAEAGLAPALIDVKPLTDTSGPWQAVFMEYMGNEDGWWPLTAFLPDEKEKLAPDDVPPQLRHLQLPWVWEDPRLHALTERVLLALKDAHKVFLPAPPHDPAAGSSTKRTARVGAHGDPRGCNVLVRVSRGAAPGDGPAAGGDGAPGIASAGTGMDTGSAGTSGAGTTSGWDVAFLVRTRCG
jgi:hypothetical protein